MSTALAPSKDFNEMEVSFIPFGEKSQIQLKVNMVRNVLTKPTAKGCKPSDNDVIKFMMLAKSRELNVFAGDGFLIGYDTKDGPEFSLVTAVQALFKRSEANPQFDGLEQGVIVKNKETGSIEYRDGDFFLEDEVLLGAWARCYRKDRAKPFYDAVKLTSFNKGFGRWNTDPGGMIVKCAQSSVLRAAFPTQLGGLYIQEEIHLHGDSYVLPPTMPPNPLISQHPIETVAAEGVNTHSAVVDAKPQTKSEKLAASRPKKAAKATEAPKPEPVAPPAETQTEIPEAAYEGTDAAAPEEETQEEAGLVDQFKHGLQYCPTYADVMKFRDTFCGQNRKHETSEEETSEIEKIAEVEGKKRLPPPAAKKTKSFE